MITLTPLAISKVKELIAESDATLGLRIAILGSGCSGFQYQMTLDKQQEKDDQAFDMDGLKVFVDSESMLFMEGTTVDYVETKDGVGFTFDNPNAVSKCGSCGEGGCGG